MSSSPAIAAPPTSLPMGLSIVPSGASLESVATKAGTLDLLSSAPGIELVRGTLKRGERLNFVPAGPGEVGAHEVCLLTDGTLVAPDTLGAQRLSAGSLITSEGLLEPVSFTAETFVRFVYITSSPMFHHISRDMNELRRLAVEIEVRDGYTADHCERLQRLSYATGLELGLNPSQLYALDFGSYLHDVGKVRVPVAILTKPSALDAGEWAIIKRHPSFGREMLEPTFMRAASPIVEQHHERSDGSGYPFGLTENEILVESAIVAVADTYDAMTSDRPYCRGRSSAEALAELDSLAGTRLPKEVVRAFRSAVSQLQE